MSANYQINAEPRSDMGKGASRRLRRKGLVPAVLYGGGQPPVSITVQHETLRLQLAHQGFYSHILSVSLQGETCSAVLRDLQRHPSEPLILHMDLLRVRDDQEIRMHVPLHFKGEAVGVKQSGGVFSHQMTDVEIACLPKHLPEFIDVDVSEMVLNQVMHLSDLKLPEGVVIPALSHGADHDLPVVTLHLPKAVVEETPVPAEGAAAVATEGAAPPASAAPAAK